MMAFSAGAAAAVPPLGLWTFSSSFSAPPTGSPPSSPPPLDRPATARLLEHPGPRGGASWAPFPRRPPASSLPDADAAAAAAAVAAFFKFSGPPPVAAAASAAALPCSRADALGSDAAATLAALSSTDALGPAFPAPPLPNKRARGASCDYLSPRAPSLDFPSDATARGHGQSRSGHGGAPGTLRFAPRAHTTSNAGDYSEDESGSIVLKRRRLSGEERQQRSRERNRMHAKKTRLRKKQQMDAMAQRIAGLEAEHGALRQQIEDRRTAYILLGIGNGSEGGPLSAALEAGLAAERADADADAQPPSPSGSGGGEDEDEESGEGGDDPAADGSDEGADGKRARRRGKYSTAERETIRRERNRMHAKKTRDRKRLFLEEAEVSIAQLERAAQQLRALMQQHGMAAEAHAVPRAPPLVTPTDEELVRAMRADEEGRGSGAPHKGALEHEYGPDGHALLGGAAGGPGSGGPSPRGSAEDE